MAKLLDMVRNSPVVKKRMGGYSLMEAESRDPFIQGITFHAHFVGSCEVRLNYYIRYSCIRTRNYLWLSSVGK